MYLIQLLLPEARNNGQPIDENTYRGIQEELSERFGGLTAYRRSPAEGIWRNEKGQTKDDVFIVEVMVDDLDRAWWEQFRRGLEESLDQKELVIRAQRIEKL